MSTSANTRSSVWRKYLNEGLRGEMVDYGYGKNDPHRNACNFMLSYGYMEEYEIARRYRDVPVMETYAGTNEIMKTIIAKNMN